MIAGAVLAALLAAAPVSPRAELDDLAARIEQLKARRLAGEGVERELERLLVRAQEVAAELERREAAGAPHDVPPPLVDELRERADALHDEADRLAAEVAALDVRIADARRAAAAEGGAGMTRGAAVASGARPAVAAARLAELLETRARLAAQLAHVRAAAAALEAEAHAEDGR